MKLKKVQVLYGGVPVAPRTTADNIVDPETGEPVDVGGGGTGGGGGSVTSVKYASSAGLTSNVTAALKAALINSAVAAVPTVTSVASAGLTSSVTDDLKIALINSAVAAVPTVTSVASAGIASDVIASVKTGIINSSVAAVPTVTSVLSATSAEVAYGLDDTLKAAIIASATPDPITSVAEAGVASSVTADVKTDILTSVNITSVASAGVANDIVATVKSDIVDSAVAAVPTITSVASAGTAEAITDVYKSSLLTSAAELVSSVASAGAATFASSTTTANSASVAGYASNAASCASANYATWAAGAGYAGPWKVSKVEDNIVIGSGAYYVGDVLSTYAGTSVASSNGNVYFYLYYSNGYHSGVEIAESAAALTSASLITGSAGFYTVLATVTSQYVTQYQYGTFRIDGRVL